jgi:DNA-binding SARP family transcriptional activator
VTVREQIKIDVLGTMDVRVSGRSVHLGGPKQRALLAALVLRHGRVVAIDQLVDVLWPDGPPVTAITKVQGHVCSIRKALAERGRTDGISALETRPPGYLLRREPVGTDLTRFDALTTAAGAAREQGDRHRAAGLLGVALGLWRGPAFADVTAPAIRAVADRLAERRLATAEDKAEIDLSLGRCREVLDELGALIRRYPLRDRLRELQLVALVRLDRTTEALDHYRLWSSMLRRERGVEPGPRVQELVAAIGRGSPFF